MNITFFVIGAIIFAAYVGLLVWSIFYNSRKQQEENYPNLDGLDIETIITSKTEHDGTYYERYHTRYKKQPKTKKGSQSRKKSYKIDRIIK